MSAENQTLDEPLGRVLVVGGSGFVGTHCLRDVLRTGGPDVQVYTLNHKIPETSKQVSGVTYLSADLGDDEAVLKAVQEAKPTVILHFASPRPFIEAPSLYERVNIQGVKNLLSACDIVGTVHAFVYCSSVSIIDNGRLATLHGDESWPVLFAPEQREPYWHSKAVGETLVLGHNAKNSQKMLTTALRVTSIFGEDDEQVIGGMIRQAKSGGFKVQIGEGRNRNCWTYVGTVTQAHVLAARCLLRERGSVVGDEMRVGGEAFFITNGEARSFWGFARQVATEAGFPVREEEVRVLPAFMAWVIGYVSEWVAWFGGRKAEIRRASLRYAVVEQVFSMEKAKRRMGFVPAVGLDEAVRRGVESFRGKLI
ncbi:hypothetical protein M409DRAFT_16600 [Zasmidium cellare ATCC 36951]|uniref:3-beta hydroxysteroid dehydrogenase/isomerase domain-containing protein n=1 Tax=Zasmidium cellare ATCC 36951 TaxID=1080233 RepID=A0A6A6D2J3_ZASCE|nr:uncharacterized protein M409DRAFT_16600 [Zasmidium cellare ATCC 36951]KAF2172638.1 hypothetical protein M409DRAFT_16600 [Zasmidium cellare ATCC 36951]